MDLGEISDSQRDHWKKLLADHADTPQAVGSESSAHKRLRYEKAAELLRGVEAASVHEIGPGVGDFYLYLDSTHIVGPGGLDYSASEIVSEYCDIAKSRFPQAVFLNRDVLEGSVDETYDFVILSGVFHQLATTPHREWIRYMEALLIQAWQMTRRGLSFNVLSSHADFYKPGNYYADAAALQHFVVRRMSRFFRIDHSYPLFEATFQVFRPEHVRKLYCQDEFRRYLENE